MFELGLPLGKGNLSLLGTNMYFLFTCGSSPVISRIADDLLSPFSKLFAKSFTNKLLSAGIVDSLFYSELHFLYY